MRSLIMIWFCIIWFIGVYLVSCKIGKIEDRLIAASVFIGMLIMTNISMGLIFFTCLGVTSILDPVFKILGI